MYDSIVEVADRLEAIKDRQEQIEKGLELLTTYSMKTPSDVPLYLTHPSDGSKGSLALLPIFLSNEQIESALHAELKDLGLESKKIQPVIDKANLLLSELN